MKKTLPALFIGLLAGTALAGDLLQWQDNSLSYLYGDNYKLDPATQHTLTFEHASGWSMGDLFIFVDGTWFNGQTDLKGDRQSYYGEIAPRLSAGKLTGRDLSVLFIKDLLLAGCYEFGKNADDTPLIGAGIDLDIPGFDFVQLNAYRRFHNGDNRPEAYQLTPVWKISFPVAKTVVVCDGFIDWVIGNGIDNLHICPQLKLDVGVFAGLREQSLMAGIEYDYWKNKYGVQDGSFGLDSNQNTASLLVKYHF